MQLDGGSNSHVLKERNQFVQYKKSNILVQQVSGIKTMAQGYGIEIIRIPQINMIIPLWPVYHMPNNTQNTFIQNAVKYYNKYRSV